MAANDYLILRHENVGFWELVCQFVFKRKTKRKRRRNYVDSNSTISELEFPLLDYVTAFTLLLQKFFSAISTPLRYFGLVLEFFLNFLSLNGGLLGIPRRIITASLEFPIDRMADNFRSLISHIDGRNDLQHNVPFMDTFSRLDPIVGLNVSPMNLSIMAAKLSYENQYYIEKEVTQQWKMHFVQFFSCWNKYIQQGGKRGKRGKMATQAFIFCDKAEDANVIVLAFRGTEPFNADDWITDVDFSWLPMGRFGRVHAGFMRALGIQDYNIDGFPAEHSSSTTDNEGRKVPLAYYAIREKLKSLLVEHTNAKILITGHSLGGALAILFPSILAMHEQQSILNSIYAVITFGQPRVGDQEFGRYVESFLGDRYHRVVYSYDIVPRVPFDKPPIAQFKHFGTCVYFENWFQAQVVGESPNRNYVDPVYLLRMHLRALRSLLMAIFLGLARVEDFEEGSVSIFLRALGILFPGLAFHGPRDYVNCGKMAIEFKIKDAEKKY